MTKIGNRRRRLKCALTLEVSGRRHELHEDTVPIRSGPLERIVRRAVLSSVRSRRDALREVRA